MANEQIQNVLSKYIPAEAVTVCTQMIVQLNIHLRITKSRASRYGDYRPHPDNGGHIITVNHDLNQFAFLVTFIHEVAHLVCEKKYGRRILPHGKEWKHEYALLLDFFLSKNIFPEDIEHALKKYMRNPAASSCSDEHLHRTLKKYNSNSVESYLHLEEIPEGALFTIASSPKLLFKKGEKMRKRFRCTEIISGNTYFVNALAEVVLKNEVAPKIFSAGLLSD